MTKLDLLWLKQKHETKLSKYLLNEYMNEKNPSYIIKG